MTSSNRWNATLSAAFHQNFRVDPRDPWRERGRYRVDALGRPLPIVFIDPGADMAGKAKAFMSGRGYVIPEDIRSVAMSVLRHRIGLTFEAEAEEIIRLGAYVTGGLGLALLLGAFNVVRWS